MNANVDLTNIVLETDCKFDMATKNDIDKVLFGKLNAAVSIRLKRVFQST